MSQRSIFNQRNMPQASDESTKTASGMSRKGASSAKPAREAAGSVRVVTVKKDRVGNTTTTGMTKEEKKAQRKKEREEDDQVVSLTNMILGNNEGYRKNRRIWWVFMIIGLVFCALTFACSYLGGAGSNNFDLSTTIGILSVVTLALAYVFIIAAFVWDWIKIHPVRNQTMDEVRGMSDKRRRAVVEACYIAEEQRKNSKKKATSEDNTSK